MYCTDSVNPNVMQGLTLKAVHKDDDHLAFFTTCGQVFLMYHQQDCCECVSIEDICGDLDDIVGSPLTNAEEVSNYHETFSLLVPHSQDEDSEESYTWTYYKFDTAKGGVTIRWYGSSNGYYSESVDVYQRTEENSEDFDRELSFIPTDILTSLISPELTV